ncbi:enoyl-CoA hydratase/isomerase family protein [Caulobacter sp. 17J65-9]|uniref:enoyl-CoA hydratase/isomerase family protein n=1 Tax=Caulobacter sp. 17J65-9 TaxID=2709382 RepID=UPI0013CA7A69|nr:enoyl-CoA hydratase/isomerase family protein [Caulobacter sp. 17J65-9]NEX92066.1 enoyl-CoA hydratase/isomerase family protein [Caulobacter sp. 17J65-9]
MTDVLIDEAPVLTRVEGRVGRITLNRPKAIHALTEEMCRLMTEALLAWKDDAGVEAVILDHAGERGFCAGGDIRMIAESGKTDAAEAKAFFKTEYRLNHLLYVYPKPVVAFVDGIVMGGGVGISDPARYRVATERTTYAMPETGIGLFPDVGGGWFLPRMPGQTGVWLALTGARLKAAECLSLGIATHFVESAKLDAVKAAIVAEPGCIADILADAGGDAGPSKLEPHRADIDRLFAHDAMEAIFAALEADGSEWAAKELAGLKTKSPQSMKVSLRQMRVGATLGSFAENMAMEYRLGGRVVRSHDFQEGVRAVIVDKDNAPKWSPAELAGVDEAMVDAFFAPLPTDEEWTPLPGVG